MSLSLLNPVMFLVVFLLIIPKGIETYMSWKKGGKPMTLSLALALFMIGFSILSANYLYFIKIVLRGFDLW